MERLPIAWNGMVYIGTFGAERACGCIVAGLDAATGRVVWTFPLVPTGDAPGAETWPKGAHVGGGSTWTSYTIDPDSGLLYVPTRNPGPDFSGAYRPGANLYTGSVVALDAATGKELWWAAVDRAQYQGGGDAGAVGNQGGDGPRSTPVVSSPPSLVQLSPRSVDLKR